MIAGFTVVLNGVRNGYPFLEAIRSALPLCDEVHVSEGFSEDETWEVLQKFAAHEPKVKLRRDRWTPGPAGSAFRNILNIVRNDLTAELIYQFDANDILPPEAVAIVRELPTVYPRRELFALPYHEYLGRYWFAEYFRFRFFRNLPEIQALWDGWTFGYHLGPSDLLRPREFRRALGRTALAIVQDRVAVDLPEQIVHIPRPIFHYYGLFPAPFLEKMRAKVWLQDNPRYRELSSENARVRAVVEAYDRDHDYDRFWKSILDLQRAERFAGFRLNKEFQFVRYVPEAEHPEIMRPVLGQDRYLPAL